MPLMVKIFLHPPIDIGTEIIQYPIQGGVQCRFICGKEKTGKIRLKKER